MEEDNNMTKQTNQIGANMQKQQKTETQRNKNKTFFC